MLPLQTCLFIKLGKISDNPTKTMNSKIIAAR